MSRKIAAVTGATGFLGGHVVPALAERGFDVRVLVRGANRHPLWRDIGPEIVQGSLHDEPALRKLVRNADVVVHAAGATAARSRREFFAINCDGTRRLADAVVRNEGRSRLVLVSSLAAREPHLSSYAASKFAAEQVAAATLGDANRLTIVRPPAIYGPWDRAMLPFFRAAARHIAPKLPDRNHRVALIHVEDAAAAIAQLAIQDRLNLTYVLSDPNTQGYSWREIHQALAHATGNTPNYVSVPEWLLKAAAATAAVAQVFVRKPMMLSPGKIRELLHPDWCVDALDLPPPSVWQPKYDIKQGFHLTAAWYRSVCWLPQ